MSLTNLLRMLFMVDLSRLIWLVCQQQREQPVAGESCDTELPRRHIFMSTACLLISNQSWDVNEGHFSLCYRITHGYTFAHMLVLYIQYSHCDSYIRLPHPQPLLGLHAHLAIKLSPPLGQHLALGSVSTFHLPPEAQLHPSRSFCGNSCSFCTCQLPPLDPLSGLIYTTPMLSVLMQPQPGLLGK